MTWGAPLRVELIPPITIRRTMARTLPEAHLAKIIRDAAEQERPLAAHEWELVMWQTQHAGAALPDGLRDQDHELRDPFADKLEQVYRAAIVVLESRGHPEYLSHFYGKFGKPFDKWKQAHAFETPEDGAPEPRSTCLHEFREFLAPLGIIADTNATIIEWAGSQFLERALKNTAAFLHQLDIHPDSETDINRTMRKVLALIFPSIPGASNSGIQKLFRNYKPDILIPELTTAIEFKYVNSAEDLGSAFGEIAEDAHAYAGGSEYTVFYAVYYLTRDFEGEERYQQAWSQFAFPDNWRPLFVVGHGR